MRRAVINGGSPMLLRSTRVSGVNEATVKRTRRVAGRNAAYTERDFAGVLFRLFANRSATQRLLVLDGQVPTAVRLAAGCCIEWQWALDGRVSWCWIHCAVHTNEAAWVTSSASKSAAMVAGRARGAADLRRRVTVGRIRRFTDGWPKCNRGASPSHVR